MAAAEWILRCGGGVRFVSHPSTTRDYNILSHAKGGAKIESIDATESCVMSLGFPYLRGLTVNNSHGQILVSLAFFSVREFLRMKHATDRTLSLLIGLELDIFIYFNIFVSFISFSWGISQ
jgi:hypothetical protein